MDRRYLTITGELLAAMTTRRPGRVRKRLASLSPPLPPQIGNGLVRADEWTIVSVRERSIEGGPIGNQ